MLSSAAPPASPQALLHARAARFSINVSGPSLASEDFLDFLEKKGELRRITTEVDPYLEMTEISDRVLRKAGPALLFENPKGYSTPVLANLFGTEQRVALGMGARRHVALVLDIVLGFGSITWYSAQAGTSWHFAHVLALTFPLWFVAALAVIRRTVLAGLLALAGLPLVSTFLGRPPVEALELTLLVGLVLTAAARVARNCSASTSAFCSATTTANASVIRAG